MAGRETPGQRARRDARYLRENPEKARARWAVKYALKTGRLTRGGCRLAGPDCDGPIQAHHWDYYRPLEVTWLCAKHHRRADRMRPLGVEPRT